MGGGNSKAKQAKERQAKRDTELELKRVEGQIKFTRKKMEDCTKRMSHEAVFQWDDGSEAFKTYVCRSNAEFAKLEPGDDRSSEARRLVTDVMEAFRKAWCMQSGGYKECVKGLAAAEKKHPEHGGLIRPVREELEQFNTKHLAAWLAYATGWLKCTEVGGEYADEMRTTILEAFKGECVDGEWVDGEYLAPLAGLMSLEEATKLSKEAQAATGSGQTQEEARAEAKAFWAAVAAERAAPLAKMKAQADAIRPGLTKALEEAGGIADLPPSGGTLLQVGKFYRSKGDKSRFGHSFPPADLYYWDWSEECSAAYTEHTKLFSAHSEALHKQTFKGMRQDLLQCDPLLQPCGYTFTCKVAPTPGGASEWIKVDWQHEMVRQKDGTKKEEKVEYTNQVLEVVAVEYKDHFLVSSLDSAAGSSIEGVTI